MAGTAASLPRGLRPWNYAVVGCVGYLLTFAAPLPWDLSLVLLGGCGILAALRAKNAVAFRRMPLMPEAALFLSTVALSTVLSQDTVRSLTFSAALLPAVLLFYLIAAHFRAVADLRAVFLALTALSFALSVGILLMAWWSSALTPRDWIALLGAPILVVPNDSLLLAVIVPLSVAVLFSDERPWARVLAAAALVVGLAAIVVLQSRGAMLTFLIAGGLMAIMHRPRAALAGLAAGGLLFVLVDGLLGFPMAARIGIMNDRLSLWLAAGAMFLDRPVSGYGPHTYELFYRAKLAAIDLPPWLPVNIDLTPWPHNLYLEVAAEQGLLGLAALGLLVARALVLVRRARGALAGAAKAYASACLCGVIALLVAGLFELTLLRIWVVVLLFVLVGAISQLTRSAHAGIAE